MLFPATGTKSCLLRKLALTPASVGAYGSYRAFDHYGDWILTEIMSGYPFS